MKKGILILVALLLLGGIGGGAYMFFGKSAEASVSPGDLNDQAKKELNDKEKAEADSKVAFVKMDPLTLPVVNEKGVVQIINISITLEAADAEAAKEIEKFAPRLKDAYIQDMYGVLGRKGAVNAEGIVQVNKVKERLNKITTKVMGAEKVRDVLLQAVQQRPV
ncbi:MAG: flagellar basal body-associated FliL family protein [Alphaproteobacteria bacterium]|jgi:flagellar FliL protein|nr:flagellar basal body-associated FliL family protein [Alphaproteobacteria bacterium]MCB1551035.1 flagellar basal body-associated FliL family protein [Alphaproteobacteria bacterium]MCB9984606.1 flagellar basal body-associated FliL family protein [Micavibrio sp.]HPQ50448.1 flagellar basal body-associated FliL family protein [Alphaproteobacteria bacterium]HRK97949.1 flagellar basal body-associated FliL family protein [Alphaproteobacteria bacterium]